MLNDTSRRLPGVALRIPRMYDSIKVDAPQDYSLWVTCQRDIAGVPATVIKANQAKLINVAHIIFDHSLLSITRDYTYNIWIRLVAPNFKYHGQTFIHAILLSKISIFDLHRMAGICSEISNDALACRTCYNIQ